MITPDNGPVRGPSAITPDEGPVTGGTYAASIGDSLLPYTGKTVGLLDKGSGEPVQVVSGRTGPAQSMPPDTPGMTIKMAVRDHVEADAAAIMRKEKLQEAVLYINNPEGPCIGDIGCNLMLPHMLPEKATLTVYYPTDEGWQSQTYTGVSDSEWPPPEWVKLVP